MTVLKHRLEYQLLVVVSPYFIDVHGREDGGSYSYAVSREEPVVFFMILANAFMNLVGSVDHGQHG